MQGMMRSGTVFLEERFQRHRLLNPEYGLRNISRTSYYEQQYRER